MAHNIEEILGELLHDKYPIHAFYEEEIIVSPRGKFVARRCRIGGNVASVGAAIQLDPHANLHFSFIYLPDSFSKLKLTVRGWTLYGSNLNLRKTNELLTFEGMF